MLLHFSNPFSPASPSAPLVLILPTIQVGHFPFTLVELIDSSAYDDELAAFEVAFNVQMDEIYGTTN